MTRACHTAIHMAVGDAFSEAEIDDMLARLAARKRAAKQGAPTRSDEAAWREAAAEMTKTELKAALIDKRMRIFAAKAKARRASALAKMGGDPARNLQTFIEGDERQGFGRAYSVDAMGRALESDLLAEVERGLRKGGLWDRVAGLGGARDDAFEEAVTVELARRSGGREAASGDADAVKVAEVLGAALDRSRQLQNDEGAWIGKLDGYAVRQSHDPLKVAGGFWRDLKGIKALSKGGAEAVAAAADLDAFLRWRDTISPLLDEKTFADVTDRAEFLSNVWFNIVTGRHQVIKGMTDLGDYTPPASKVRSVSAERVLHFKDAKAWLAYHREFGTGSVFSAAVSDLRRGARNTALMRAFGPAPEAAFAAELERAIGAAKVSGDARGGKRLVSGQAQAAFDHLNGAADAPENLRLAMIGQAIRGHETITKLGGMVLSAFADMPVAAQTLFRGGVGWLDSYAGVFKGAAHLGGADQRVVGDLMDVGARAAAGRLSSRFAARDGALGWISHGQRLTMLIQGFEWWNDGLRSGVATMLARDLGRQADKAWGGLNIGTRETFERFGIDAAGWDTLRKGASDLEGGRYLTLEAAGDDMELGLRFKALVSETLDNATSEARGRERRQMAGGTQRGTLTGEAVRLFLQFWSFPQTFIGRSLAPAAQGYAGQKPAALIAHLVLSTTLFGYVSMQAKQMAKGREPRALSKEAVMAAALQGGGLGIYGDFLFGEHNRFGGSPVANLGGPAIGDFEQALKLWGKIRAGEDPAAEAFQFAKANTPFINTWYARAALDYALFWRMQEALNPGWAGRYEKRVEKDTGAGFWLRPTEGAQ